MYGVVYVVGLDVGCDVGFGLDSNSVVGCDRLWVAIVCVGYDVA